MSKAYEMYKQIDIPQGVSLLPCPCCGMDAQLWRYAKSASDFTIKKLSAGVSVEPVACVARSNDMEGLVQWALKRVHVGVDLFTLDQLNTALAAARVQMEKAIKDAYMEGFFSMATYNDTQVNDENEEWEKSNAKRSLLGKEAQS